MMDLTFIRKISFVLLTVTFIFSFHVGETSAGCDYLDFECNSHRCIPLRWRCDQEDDCGDGSDEVDCDTQTCSDTEFACDNGKCILSKFQCDSDDDCGDRSDENPEVCHTSQRTCSGEHFMCHSDNRCIPKTWRCDRENDCLDGSDELDCSTVTCKPTEFMCGNGKCIPEQWRCDSSIDCSDQSDEENCLNTGAPTSVCGPGEFMCANKKDCIHMMLQCDGKSDCPDGSDEHNCNITCRPYEFQCKNLQCIPDHLQCNEIAECPDGSDEEHCIGINECSNNTGGCSQICVKLPVGFRCECREGYRLADNKTCEDIDECEVPGACSQICHNMDGNYTCECLSGYVLEPDNMHRCRAAEGHPVLLFANRYDIRKIDLETGEYVLLGTGLHGAVAIDYDFQTGTIFWSEVNDVVIKSAPIDTGTPVTTVISEDISTPDGIAVDWIYGHIYWTDAGKNTIEMADKSGKMRKTLIDKNLDKPRAIVLNPLDGWMYWTDWGEPAQVGRAGMDGSHRSTIVSSDIYWPNGLAIDFVLKKIFWIEAKFHTLSCADFNGDNKRVVLSSRTILNHPFSIDVFEDWIYWTDWNSQSIQKINKFDGSNRSDVFFPVPSSQMGVRVYHPFKQPDGENHCKNVSSRCSHLCLPSPNITSHSPRYTCACPNGMKLNEDGVTCASLATTHTVYTSSAVMMTTEENVTEATATSPTGYTSSTIMTSTEELAAENYALVWHLMRECSSGPLAGTTDTGPSSVEEEILELVNNRLKEAGKQSSIKSFHDESIGNARPIIDLIDAIRPSSIDYSQVLPGDTPEERMTNAQYAISMARKIGAPVFALPEDIMEVKHKKVFRIFSCLMARDYIPSRGTKNNME